MRKRIGGFGGRLRGSQAPCLSPAVAWTIRATANACWNRHRAGRVENPEDYNIEIVDEDGETLVDQPLSDEAFDIPVDPNQYVDVVVTRPDGERVRHRVFVRRAEQLSFRIGEDGGVYDVTRIPQRRRENVGD